MIPLAKLMTWRFLPTFDVANTPQKYCFFLDQPVLEKCGTVCNKYKNDQVFNVEDSKVDTTEMFMGKI